MSSNKRVFVSLGIVGGVVVSFLLLCGFGLVFVRISYQEGSASAVREQEKAQKEAVITEQKRMEERAESTSQNATIPTPRKRNETEDKPFSTTDPKDPAAKRETPSDDNNIFIRPDGEIIDLDAKYLKFAILTIANYDENKNGVLDGAEVSEAVKELAWLKPTTDINSDDEIGPKELAAFMMEDRRSD